MSMTVPTLEMRLRVVAESLPEPVTFDDIVRQLSGSDVPVDAAWRWLHEEVAAGATEGIEPRRHSRDGLRGARQYRIGRRSAS
jgi:hypothetical protein